MVPAVCLDIVPVYHHDKVAAVMVLVVRNFGDIAAVYFGEFLHQGYLVSHLNIIGYGACMIAGYPLPAENGFLNLAVQHLRQKHPAPVDLEIVTMGGFPATRAPKHFAKRVLVHRPDVVVLQFGSTDASAPLCNGVVLRQLLKPDPHMRKKVSPHPPAPVDGWKWRLRNLASELLLVPPLTTLEDYAGAMLDMAWQARCANCEVVVVSPFVMASGRSNRFAREYTEALHRRLPVDGKTHFLDAHTLLSAAPRHELLLRDGFHLSPQAHQKVGTALGELLVKTCRA